MSDAPGKPYRPRDLALIPAHFGRDRGIQWHTPPADSPQILHEARVIAARLQHGLIYATAQANGSVQPTDRAMARRVGINTDRMGRLRRGDLPMRTEELGLLVVAYDIPLSEVLLAAGLRPADGAPGHPRGSHNGPIPPGFAPTLPHRTP